MTAKPGTRTLSGTTKVTTAQTAVQITTTAAEFSTIGVWLQADPSNTGAIVAVGDKNVNSKKTLGTTRGVVLEKTMAAVFVEVVDPSELWVDAEKSGDFVTWLAVLA